MSQILYVYGTLMREQRNHWRLFGSRYLGRATVKGQLWQFPLFDFPILRRHDSDLVHGELYQVTRGVLDVNDWYEAWYRRVRMLAQPITLHGAISGPVSCWVYEGLGLLPLRSLARRLPGRWPA
jgi:gamma-glutamylcyclotransferase (GGCT)/AIG2-like uncharacterized protein YtfP